MDVERFGPYSASAAISCSNADMSRSWRLLGLPIPMFARMIVERFLAATIIRCRFATLASPRSHIRLAPPVSQT